MTPSISPAKVVATRLTFPTQVGIEGAAQLTIQSAHIEVPRPQGHQEPRILAPHQEYR
jgi:hypothetical protein